MRQLKERITHSFRLEPLVRSDIDSYIDFRMRAAGYRGPKVFSPGAIRLIAAASQGLTRRINILADKSLLAAFAQGAHAVTEKEVKKAARDSEFHRAKSGLQKFWVGAAALAAGLALGWGATALLSGNKSLNAAGSVAQPAIATTRLSPGAAAASATVSPGSPPDASAAAGVVAPPLAVTPAAPASDVTRATTPTGADAQLPGSAAASGPVAPERGRLARERFEAAQRWLPAEAGDRYAIQLVTVSSEQLGLLEDFLLKASKLLPMGEVYIYSVKINNQQHYRVAYGSYETQVQALEAIRDLPPSLAIYRPYTRSVERMRSQNRQ
jgi:septal ring-binding cell division protein DamX